MYVTKDVVFNHTDHLMVPDTLCRNSWPGQTPKIVAKTIIHNENVSDSSISVDSLPSNLLLNRTPIRNSSQQFSRPIVL